MLSPLKWEYIFRIENFKVDFQIQILKAKVKYLIGMYLY